MSGGAEYLFLFNHDAPHQVAHLAGVAAALAGQVDGSGAAVTCATGTPAIRARAEQILGGAAERLQWIDLALPFWLETLLALPNRIAPVKRLMRLDRHAARLAEAAVIVSAERTCLRLKRRFGPGSRTRSVPRFVHVPHGAGDRAVTYHAGKGGFDRMLVSGPKAARELVGRGVAEAARVRIVGYPKFDTVDVGRKPRLFDNDRPVFLYNPHFDPFLSSWYDEGPALLDWFAGPQGQRFNLIFAPHIMLFRKALHISPEYRVARLRPGIAPAWARAPNILIDTDSARLVDMTYTLAADAYIGDVSSQIYEFLIRPRPAFFLDRFSSSPRSREARYPSWECGPVVESAAALAPLLADMQAGHAAFLAQQQALFADTFSYDPQHSASMRAAAAIAELGAA